MSVKRKRLSDAGVGRTTANHQLDRTAAIVEVPDHYTRTLSLLDGHVHVCDIHTIRNELVELVMILMEM